jgi:superfamily II DNA helicase RecQ
MRPEKGRQVAADRSQGSGKHIISACVMLLCNLLISVQVHAGTLLMARSTEQAEVSMSVLQDALKSYDYTIAHVQKCDGGMEEFDYKTDYYRVVFFGKIEEVRPIIDKHPEMAAYLPRDENALLDIHGVGEHKLQRYGSAFLSEINEFCKGPER